MAWTNGYINKNQIQHETENSVLVKAAGSDWQVWVSRKCIRQGSHNANFAAGFMNDGEYKVFRSGKGQYNRCDIIEEKLVSGAIAAKMFFVQE